MDKYIDLHVHTTASDGSMTPTQLVQYAAKKKLSAIAITDHDTINGVEEAIMAGEKYNVEVMPGIEISVDYQYELHILGYNIDYKSQSLNDTLEKLKIFRQQRNPKMVKRLKTLGLDISMEDVEEIAKGDIIARPHIAAVMVKKGYVGSIEEAFHKYLADGKAAYVKRQRLTPQEGIALIKKAGGIAVLAHPIYLEQNGIDLELLLMTLKRVGLDGIEGYYPDYSDDMHQHYIALAKKHHLLVTGGSDFHGDFRKNIELGRGQDGGRIPYHLIEKIKGKHHS